MFQWIPMRLVIGNLDLIKIILVYNLIFCMKFVLMHNTASLPSSNKYGKKTKFKMLHIKRKKILKTLLKFQCWNYKKKIWIVCWAELGKHDLDNILELILWIITLLFSLKWAEGLNKS